MWEFIKKYWLKIIGCGLAAYLLIGIIITGIIILSDGGLPELNASNIGLIILMILGWPYMLLIAFIMSNAV